MILLLFKLIECMEKYSKEKKIIEFEIMEIMERLSISNYTKGNKCDRHARLSIAHRQLVVGFISPDQDLPLIYAGPQ